MKKRNIRRKISRRSQNPTQTNPANRFLEALDKEFQKNQPKTPAKYPYNKKTNRIQLPREIDSEIIKIVVAGQKATAVKWVTQLTGAGLRISKDYVDRLIKISGGSDF